jgi:hypothetical protein
MSDLIPVVLWASVPGMLAATPLISVFLQPAYLNTKALSTRNGYRLGSETLGNFYFYFHYSCISLTVIVIKI